MVFLLMSSLWFWIFIIAFFALELWWIEGQESGIAATISLGIFIVAIHFFSDFALFSWIGAHPWHILGGVGAYFVAGSIWGFAKWFLYLKEKAQDYQEARMNFLRSHDVKNITMQTAIPEEFRDQWNKSYEARSLRRPVAVQNKSRIIMWMSYWPWSALWTLVRDPFRHIYQAFAEKLENMSSKIFGDIGYDQDHDVPEQGAVAATGARKNEDRDPYDDL